MYLSETVVGERERELEREREREIKRERETRGKYTKTRGEGARE